MGQAVGEWRRLVPDPLAVRTFDHAWLVHRLVGSFGAWHGEHANFT